MTSFYIADLKINIPQLKYLYKYTSSIYVLSLMSNKNYYMMTIQNN